VKVLRPSNDQDVSAYTKQSKRKVVGEDSNHTKKFAHYCSSCGSGRFTLFTFYYITLRFYILLD
jgi:hypothetical protein